MNAIKMMMPGGNVQQDDSWWLATMARGVGSMAGLLGILFGVLTAISISPSCIIAGSLIAFEGLIVTLIEAPCFCVFLDFSQVPSGFFKDKPHYTRATLYLIFAAVPFVLPCGLSISRFFACGLFLITSALYLMQSLGRKASMDDMRVAANSMPSSSLSAVLVTNEAPMPQKSPAPFASQPMGGSGLTGVVY